MINVNNHIKALDKLNSIPNKPIDFNNLGVKFSSFKYIDFTLQECIRMQNINNIATWSRVLCIMPDNEPELDYVRCIPNMFNAPAKNNAYGLNLPPGQKVPNTVYKLYPTDIFSKINILDIKNMDVIPDNFDKINVNNIYKPNKEMIISSYKDYEKKCKNLLIKDIIE
jgi:hypothetical protein